MREQPGPGETPVAIGVTHLLDATPTEIHVFMSMLMAKPVFVGTEKRIWSVEGPSIGLIKR